jgi:3-oxoacyl-[acyl-carrier protein] reductase
MRGLENKVVIVTGAGRGIGRATAERFCEEGARVVLAELSEELGQAAAEELRTKGYEASFVAVDVSQRASVQGMTAAVKERYGQIDVLINNAGILADKTLRKLSEDDFDKVISVNLKGTFNVTQEVAAVMREQGWGGAIVNAASVVALYGNIGQTNYVASKAGVIGMTKVWARELGRSNIRVNAVAPGFIETEMTKQMPAKITEMLVSKVPLGRMGTVAEVAALYAFLASDDGAYISGATLSVDGGVVL